MDKYENLLLTAMEECAEVQQAISKSLRFGIDSYNPDSPGESNVDSIMTEYYQLCAVIEMLQSDYILPYWPDEKKYKIMDNKIEKVKKYQNISMQIGTIRE